MSGRAGIRWGGIFNLLLILLAAGTTEGSEWPATTVQVIPREPSLVEQNKEADAVDRIVSFTSDESLEITAHSQQATGWGNRVLHYYRRAGHNPPLLPHYPRENLPPAYRVYIFPFEGSRSRASRANIGGTYATPCGYPNREPWVGINHDLWLARLPEDKFWTLAHEFMHALHYGDSLFDGCDQTSYEVGEGIPDGAAAYLTNREFPNYSGVRDVSNSAVGLRNYRLPLFMFSTTPGSRKSTLEQHTGYGTSSFWRFLIERFGGLQVIPHLSKKSLPERASQADALKWLDERLQAWKHLRPRGYSGDGRDSDEPPGLFEVYPAFVTEFASYGGARYMGFNHRTFSGERQASEAWLKKAFSGCAKVELTPANSSGQVTINAYGVTAHCLRVTYTGFKGSRISKIEVLHDELYVTGQLHLGWAWKRGPDKTENCYRKRKSSNSMWPPCVLKAFSQSGPEIGQYARTWPAETMKFGSGNYAERTWIISNIAVDPWDTRVARNITVKVGISRATVKGEPAKPMHDRRPPPKAPPASPGSMKIDRKALYGLNTSPPSPGDGTMGLSLVRDDGEGTKETGGYGVLLYDMEYGKLGPVRGMVAPHPDSGSAGSGVVVSSLQCKHSAEQPVARVLQSDENALRITVNAKLCRFGPDTIRQCESSAGCPQVDSVTGEISIPFGWRQFPETAPTDILTRDIQRYVNTMPDSLEEAMTFGRDTALPDMDDPDYEPGEGTEGQAKPSATGDGSPPASSLDSCSCTCEERQQIQLRAAQLKGQNLPDSELLSVTTELMRCQAPCQRQYMICAMDESDERRAAEKAAREEKEQSIAEQCDCSCSSLRDMQQRARELESRIGGDMGPVLAEVQQLSICFSSCQGAMMSCLGSGP